MFTDIHSHILHNIDDGPETIEQAAELLNAAVQNGCKNLIATPHFYAERHSLAERLRLADERYTALSKFISANGIPVSLLRGFEVRYFDGISRIDLLDKLCINESKIILLELEPLPFTEKVIDEILDLNYFGYTVILAHIERYSRIQGFKLIKRLIAEGNAIAQCNAASLLSGAFRRAAFRLIKEGLVSLVASDMHSLKLRPFNLNKAYDVIENKFGSDFKNQLIYNADDIFNKCLKK